MGFALDTGYVPSTVDELMAVVRENINAQFGTTYTEVNFIGTNFYKYFYSLIQRLQENEIKTSEIFLRMQEYFDVTNEKVLRPNTTAPGIYDYFASKGYLISVKPPNDTDRGKAFICVDVDDAADDYEETKLEICNLVKDCVVAGVVSQGTESESIPIANGQNFDFKFNLPNKIPTELKLTITQSENNLYTIPEAGVIKQKLYDNIVARYTLGRDFEPQRYFSVVDAPWASQILLEYDIGSGFTDDIYDAAYDDLLTFSVEDITLVEV